LNAVIKIILSMVIWGSLGLYVRNIPLSSIDIAFLRALIASIFLLIIKLFTKKRIEKISLKGLLLLIFSGIIIALNWLLLFQSYKYTTIANATLIYYTAPIFVIILSPFVLKERITLKRLLSVLISLMGLALIISQNSSSVSSYNHPIGFLFGLSAAVLYASVVIINKKIKNFSGVDRTVIQISVSALFLLPFILFKNDIHINGINMLLTIIILGVLHTGIAYLLYFSSIEKVSAQKASLLSYIDPISAVLFGTLFLGEPLSTVQALGGGLILFSTMVNIKD
jgi:drug/metabolite transporter (DMT)-like permease